MLSPTNKKNIKVEYRKLYFDHSCISFPDTHQINFALEIR